MKRYLHQPASHQSSEWVTHWQDQAMMGCYLFKSSLRAINVQPDLMMAATFSLMTSSILCSAAPSLRRTPRCATSLSHVHTINPKGTIELILNLFHQFVHPMITLYLFPNSASWRDVGQLLGQAVAGTDGSHLSDRRLLLLSAMITTQCGSLLQQITNLRAE